MKDMPNLYNLAFRLSGLLLSLAVMSIAAHLLVEGPMIRLGAGLASRIETSFHEPQRIPEA
jgi:hypothetical protein